MPVSLKHKFQSAKGDGTDATLVQPSNWNAEHDLTMAADSVLGRGATSGAATEIPCTSFGRSLIAAADAAAARGVLSPFPSGTKMLFAQTSAPAGWTKDTTHNDKALRVVSGAAGNGGSVSFSTAFTSRTVTGTVGDHTLTTAQIPAHSHNYAYTVGATPGGGTTVPVPIDYPTPPALVPTTSTGGGQPHNHSFTGGALDLAVAYVDVIIATKD